MAVFPDKIILKNSSDTDAEIRASIASGGDDEILPGEVVIRTTAGEVDIYTVDEAGAIATLGSSQSSGGGLENVVEDTTPQLGGDLDVNGHKITSAASIELSPANGEVVVRGGTEEGKSVVL